MTKEYAKELLERYSGEPDEQNIHIVSTEGTWITYTIAELKEIAK